MSAILQKNEICWVTSHFKEKIPTKFVNVCVVPKAKIYFVCVSVCPQS